MSDRDAVIRPATNDDLLAVLRVPMVPVGAPEPKPGEASKTEECSKASLVDEHERVLLFSGLDRTNALRESRAVRHWVEALTVR